MTAARGNRCRWCDGLIERCDPASLGWYHVMTDSRWCKTGDGEWIEAKPKPGPIHKASR